MLFATGKTNLSEEDRTNNAWRLWMQEIDKSSLDDTLDIFIAMRPQWKRVGCEWGDVCRDGKQYLACKFWDAKNNGSLAGQCSS